MPHPTLNPYPAYKPSVLAWLGDVPAHWEVRRLKAVCRLSYGDSLPADTRYEGPILVYGSNGPVGTHRTANTRAPCIVVGRKGSFGKIHFSAKPVFAIDTTYYVDQRYSTSNLAWLSRVLSWARLDDVTRDSAIPGLSREDAYERYVPIPPLSQQRAIVRYLDHVDDRIRRYVTAKEKLIALLEEERQAVTLEAIQSPLTTSQRLETVADIVERPVERTSDHTYTPIGLYNRGRGIFKKDLRSGSDLGDSDFFWVHEGDLVISGQFAWEGAIALASDVEHGCVASHRYPILRGKPGTLDSGFLLGFFRTDWGQLLLDHNSRGAAGRNRPLNAGALMKEKIKVPPISSQRRISQMLELESHVREQVRLSKQLLQEYRTRLIADVVTGKLDVREAAARLPDGSDDGQQYGERAVAPLAQTET